MFKIYNLFQFKILSLILTYTLSSFGSSVDGPKQSVFAKVLLKEGLRSVVLVGKLETMTNGLVENNLYRMDGDSGLETVMIHHRILTQIH